MSVANLMFDEKLLEQLMKDYDDDNTGEIDYRKFCENVMGSHPDDAGTYTTSVIRHHTPSVENLRPWGDIQSLHKMVFDDRIGVLRWLGLELHRLRRQNPWCTESEAGEIYTVAPALSAAWAVQIY